MLFNHLLKCAPEDGNGTGGGGGAPNAGGGAAGGAGESGNKGGEGGGAGESKTVSKEDHDRALADLHRFKTAAKAKEDEAKALQDQINQLKTSGMKAKEDWKALAEQFEGEAKAAREELTKVKSGIAATFKSMQVKSEAQKLGIKESAMRDLDLLQFDDVEAVFGTDGKVTVNGAKEAAELLKKTRDHWFTTGKVENINTGGTGGGNPEVLTSAYMNELEKKDPAKYKQLMPKYVKQINARKSK